MRYTGIVRDVDKMGRIVIPKEIRKQLKVEAGKDAFDIYVEGNYIILQKFEPVCVFCGGSGESVWFGGYTVCCDCIHKLNRAEDDLKELLERIRRQTEWEIEQERLEKLAKRD